MKPISLTIFSLVAITVGAAHAQSAGTFSPAGRMIVARSLHTATLLPDGRVLIAGGRIHGVQDYRGTVTAGAELYDPVTGTFSPTGSMSKPRAWHSATLLPNGKVLIVGRDWQGGDDRTAELYDPATGRFARTGNTMMAQYAASATLLQDGRVLIAAGTTPLTGRVSIPELYDPATGAFAQTGTFLGPGDGYQVRGGPNSPAVALMSDGRVLFAAEPFSEEYDPIKQRFNATGSMKTRCAEDPRFGPPSYIAGRTATLLSTGEVLLTGGGAEDCGRFAQAERYDPDSGTFVLVPPMTRQRFLHTATRLLDGTVLLAGGESASGRSLVSEATAEIYDPATATFHLAGSTLQTGRQAHTATLLKDGRVLLTGGVLYQGVGVFLGSLDSTDIYTPETPRP